MNGFFLKVGVCLVFVRLAETNCWVGNRLDLRSGWQEFDQKTPGVNGVPESANNQIQFIGMKKYYSLNQPVRFVLWNHGPATNPIQIQLEVLTEAGGDKHYEVIEAEVFVNIEGHGRSSHFPKIAKNAKHVMVWLPTASSKTFFPRVGKTYRFLASELGPFDGGTAAYYSPPFRFVPAIKTRRHKSKVRSAIGAG